MAKLGSSKEIKMDAGKGREPGLSIIADGMKVTGQIDSNGVVKVEGQISGSIRAERQVLVATGGNVEGDIYTVEAVIAGTVTGSIIANERVEIQASSVVNGDITTQRIVVHEGGEVNGNLKMAKPDALGAGRQAATGVARDQPASAGEKSGSRAAV